MADDPRLEDPRAWGFPLNKLTDIDTFTRWRREMGKEDTEEMLNTACRDHMQRYGVRAILPVVQRIDDLCAQMEEFTDDA